MSSPMNDTDSPLYMSVEKVEACFSIPCRTAWKLIASGQITASRVGRKWAIEVKSVLAFLKRNKNMEVENAN